MAVAACCASLLVACNEQMPANIALAQPRGATVAFDSIDGLPRPQFQTLVQKLNDEAQSRRLAVISREGSSAYRVRGYLTATVARDQTTIAWVWDVFDSGQQRVLQIKGEEAATQPLRNVEEAWKVADDAMLRRIAQSSMDQLSVFLTSPDVAPNGPAAAQNVVQDDSSPEAAGIFQIYRANADPLLAAPLPAGPQPGGPPATVHAKDDSRDGAGSAPLPPRRPQASAARSANAAPAAARPALALLERKFQAPGRTREATAD
jgi:hypothetical protein